MTSLEVPFFKGNTIRKLENHVRKMLTSALRAMVKNPVKKVFMGKEKKKINVLTTFFISHKSDVKIFLNSNGLNNNRPLKSDVKIP